jgi:hypothetical protein
MYGVSSVPVGAFAIRGVQYSGSATRQDLIHLSSSEMCKPRKFCFITCYTKILLPKLGAL